jgi:hypothetical protein
MIPLNGQKGEELHQVEIIWMVELQGQMKEKGGHCTIATTVTRIFQGQSVSNVQSVRILICV